MDKKKKKYLWHFILFVLLLFAFDRGLFYFIQGSQRGFYKKKDFKKIFFQKRDFNKHFVDLPRGTYNTLIMGSSRTHRGIHPFYIHKFLGQNAFKIAKAKVRLKFNYYFYKEYKKYASAPKVVIYGVDYFMFKLESHPYFLQFVMDNDSNIPPYDNGLLLLVKNKTRIDTFLDNVLERWNNNLSPQTKMTNSKNIHFPIIDPFVGYGKKEPLDETKPALFDTFEYKGFPGLEGVYFTKLLEEWEKDGVKVILVFLPEYIGTYYSNIQQDAFINDIRNITKNYNNVYIYNYNLPNRFSLKNPAYFLDGGYGKTNSHLSRKGARVFNRMLTRDIKKHYQIQNP